MGVAAPYPRAHGVATSDALTLRRVRAANLNQWRDMRETPKRPARRRPHLLVNETAQETGKLAGRDGFRRKY